MLNSSTSFFLRCPFCPVALYSSFAEIVMLTASLHLDIAMTTLFRHASLFDGTLRFIAVFASFKDKSNCLAAWNPKQNETKLFFLFWSIWLCAVFQNRTTAETISREVSHYHEAAILFFNCGNSIACSSNISVVISYNLF